jgi:hypothetical protein
MFFGLRLRPTRIDDQIINELGFSRRQIDHAAVVVSDERYRRDAAYGNGVRDFELAIAEVGSASADDEREVIGNMKMLVCKSQMDGLSCGIPAGLLSALTGIGERCLQPFQWEPVHPSKFHLRSCDKINANL